MNMGETTAKLLRDVDLFGLSSYGNRMTLMKCHVTNVLFSGDLFIIYFLLVYNVIIFTHTLITIIILQVIMSAKPFWMTLIPQSTWPQDR